MSSGDRATAAGRADDVEAVQEILAERPLADARARSRWVAATMRTSTSRSLASRRPARTPPLSSTRSSFACSAGVISAISSRNSVPPSASTNRPGAIGDRARERTLDVAEQLALEQRLGQRARSSPARTAALARCFGVQRARDQLLAGPGLAEHEHRRGRVGDPRIRSRRASIAPLWPMMLAVEKRARRTCLSAAASWRISRSANARSRNRASSSCLNGFVR